MWRRMTTVAWWLGVSAYFGGLLTLGAVVAPAVFQTTEKAAMTMPGVASPPLKMGGEVGGEIFGEVLQRFAVVEEVALWLMVIGIAGYYWAHRPTRRSVWVLLVMWFLLLGVKHYDGQFVRPKVFELRTLVRQEAPAHATEGADAMWPTRIEFRRLHDRAEMLGRLKVYLLLGMILVSAWRGLAERPVKPVMPVKPVIPAKPVKSEPSRAAAPGEEV